MAYAVLTSHSIEHIGTWGSDGNGDPVTESTPFLWGSVSKPVTAAAVMTLVEPGAIELDQPVRSYLPSFTLADADAAERITVRHLLEQTSGIPEGTGITDRFDRRRDPYGESVADLSDVAPQSEPGERYVYSSANYVVLGAVVEAVSGRSFTGYLREHLLQPLGMDGAITSPDEAAAGLPDGHAYAFGRPIRATPCYDPTGPSYGYLGGTVADLARFAMDQLGGGGGSRVLETSSVSQMQTGTARISDTHHYGLGWRDDDRNADLGTRTIWHGGAVNGYQAMVVLLPDLDRGIVVLQNIYGFFQDSQLAAAGLGAARILAGGEPAPISRDLAYPLLLAGLVAGLVAVVTLLGWGIYRLLHPARVMHRRGRLVATTAGWTVGGVTLAYLVTVVLPASAGTSFRLVRLYTPDVSWLLIAVAVGALALAAARLSAGVIRLRQLTAGRAEN
jgi:CubicO group peptidase (beta-lactamase class C family)